MTPKLSAFAETIAKANDQFMAEYKLVDTLMGIIDKALRQQGMAADAVTVDAPALNKKIVFLLPDELSDEVEVAFGDKTGAINSKQRYSINELTAEAVVAIMANYFEQSLS